MHDDSSTVHTVSLSRPPTEDDPERCCFLMTVGARRKSRVGRKQASYSRGNGKKVPCPKQGSRKIGGKWYCGEHYPDRGPVDPYYKTSAWIELRRATLDRDSHRCRYCGKKAVQADHVIARSKGGQDALENLVACCMRCNKLAGGALFLDFSEKKRWLLSNIVK